MEWVGFEKGECVGEEDGRKERGLKNWGKKIERKLIIFIGEKGKLIKIDWKKVNGLKREGKERGMEGNMWGIMREKILKKFIENWVIEMLMMWGKGEIDNEEREMEKKKEKR